MLECNRVDSQLKKSTNFRAVPSQKFCPTPSVKRSFIRHVHCTYSSMEEKISAYRISPPEILSDSYVPKCRGSVVYRGVIRLRIFMTFLTKQNYQGFMANANIFPIPLTVSKSCLKTRFLNSLDQFLEAFSETDSFAIHGLSLKMD